MFDPSIQYFSDVHQQSAEEEQCQKRNAHDDSKGIPIISPSIVVQIFDLYRKIARHETDG